MQKVLHETCLEYLQRRQSEGWKLVDLEGYNAVLLSPEGIRRELDLRNDVETLRPNAPGDSCQFRYQIGAPCPNHYQNVDEESQDGGSTENYDSGTVDRTDLFNIEDSGVGTGTINHITVYWWCHWRSSYWKEGYLGIKSGATVDWGNKITFETAYAEYSRQFNTDPATSAPWTRVAIDVLQVGYRLNSSLGGLHCTQIYGEVDFTPVVEAPTVTTQAADGIGFD